MAFTMHRNSASLRMRIASMLAIISLGVAILVVTSTRSSAISPDEQAIENVIVQAGTAKDSLAIADTPAAGAPLGSIDAANVQRRASALLSSMYAPSSPLLSARMSQVQHGLDMQRGGGFRMLAGGIRDVNFESITITGTVASAHLTFVNWIVDAVRQDDGRLLQFNPSNKMLEDVHLIKTPQGWRITSDVGQFAPGSEP